MWLLRGGHAWDTTRYGDTVNERAVRILVECILVSCRLSKSLYTFVAMNQGCIRFFLKKHFFRLIFTSVLFFFLFLFLFSFCGRPSLALISWNFFHSSSFSFISFYPHLFFLFQCNHVAESSCSPLFFLRGIHNTNSSVPGSKKLRK